MTFWHLGNGSILGIEDCPAELANFLHDWFYFTPHPGPATLELRCFHAKARPSPIPPMDNTVAVTPAADGKSAQLCCPHAWFDFAEATPGSEIWLGEEFWHNPIDLQREFFGLMMLWLLKRQGVILHGSCVADAQGRGLLCVGTSGSGKSTTAYALIREGLRGIADDLVWLWPASEGLLHVIALQRGAHLDRRLAAHYPELGPAIALTNPLKDLFQLDALHPRTGIPNCVPRVILFPSVTGQPMTDVQPRTPPASLPRLLAQCGAIALKDGYSQQRLTLLQALTRQALTCELRLGADTHGDSARLATLLVPLLEGLPHA